MRAARVLRAADRAGFVVVHPVRLPLAGVRLKHGLQRALRGRGEGVAGLGADGLSVFLPAREMRRFRVDRGGDRDGIAVGERAAAARFAVALRAHGDLKFRGVDGEGGLVAGGFVIGAGHHAAVLPAVHVQRGFGGGVGGFVHAGAVLHVLPAGAVVHLPLIAHRALRRHGEAGRRALHGRGVGRLGGNRQLCAQRKGLHRAGHVFAGGVDDSVVALPHQRAAHPGDALRAGRGEAAGAHGQLERAPAVHGAAAQVDGHGVDVRACRDFQHRGVVAVIVIILVVSLRKAVLPITRDITTVRRCILHHRIAGRIPDSVEKRLVLRFCAHDVPFAVFCLFIPAGRAQPVGNAAQLHVRSENQPIPIQVIPGGAGVLEQIISGQEQAVLVGVAVCRAAVRRLGCLIRGVRHAVGAFVEHIGVHRAHIDKRHPGERLVRQGGVQGLVRLVHAGQVEPVLLPYGQGRMLLVRYLPLGGQLRHACGNGGARLVGVPVVVQPALKRRKGRGLEILVSVKAQIQRADGGIGIPHQFEIGDIAIISLRRTPAGLIPATVEVVGENGQIAALRLQHRHVRPGL